MKEDFYINLSNRFYSRKTTGIAFVGAKSKKNKGCALSDHLKRDIKKYLFESVYKDNPKLYAIYIYFLIKVNLNDIRKLIICNDENFRIVKKYLLRLFKKENLQINFNIISIGKYRESLGRRISSLADNYARVYARRALKPTRWNCGKKINVVKLKYEMIENEWKQLE